MTSESSFKTGKRSWRARVRGRCDYGRKKRSETTLLASKRLPDHRPKNVGGPCWWKKERNGPSRASRQDFSPTDTLIWAHWDPCWISKLHNYKMMDLWGLAIRGNLLQQLHRTNTVNKCDFTFSRREISGASSCISERIWYTSSSRWNMFFSSKFQQNTPLLSNNSLITPSQIQKIETSNILYLCPPLVTE